MSRQPEQTLAIAITGSGGSGVVTLGQLLLDAAGRSGLQGTLSRSSGPQIRGGESAVMLQLASHEVAADADAYDLLLALDWNNAARFADEIPLSEGALVLHDPQQGEIPEPFASSIQSIPIALQAEAKRQGLRTNMLALGLLGEWLGLDDNALQQAMEKRFARQHPELLQPALAAATSGRQLLPDALPICPIQPPGKRSDLWNISGNEACGYGALQAGVRLVAAYPITPASEILEWLGPRLEPLGGHLLQAEDELASINMVIGAGFGGVPALTATSGPGLSLMSEGMGLAVASETPAVVIDVMRGGPSTGIPTKSEQSDLEISLYGLHGDTPHLVLACLDIADCAFTTAWAVQLAQQLQTLAVVLSDQALGQSRSICPPARLPQPLAMAQTAPGPRYQETESGISPMPTPGEPGRQYTADGLEHNVQGTPSSRAADHLQQLEKRRRKLQRFDYSAHWGEQQGTGPWALLGFGSTWGSLRAAARRLEQAGHPTRAIGLRLLSPLPHEELTRALEGCERILVVEQNHDAQLFHYLLAQRVLGENSRSLAQPGPLRINPGRIVAQMLEATDEAH